MTFDIDINSDELKLYLEHMRESTSAPIKFRHYVSSFFRAAKALHSYHDLSTIAKREGLKGERCKARNKELKEKYGWKRLGADNDITQFVYQKRNFYDHEQALKLAIAAGVSIPKINLNFEAEIKMEDFYGDWRNPLKATLIRNGIPYNIEDKHWNYEFRYFFREWVPKQEVSMSSEGPDVFQICEKYFEYAKGYSSKLKEKLLQDGLIEK